MTARPLGTIESGVRQGGVDVQPILPPELTVETLYQTSLIQSNGHRARKARDDSYVDGGKRIEEFLRQTETDARGYDKIRKTLGAENLLMYKEDIVSTRDSLRDLAHFENIFGPTGLYDRIQLNLAIYTAFVEKIDQLKTQRQTKQ